MMGGSPRFGTLAMDRPFIVCVLSCYGVCVIVCVVSCYRVRCIVCVVSCIYRVRVSVCVCGACERKYSYPGRRLGAVPRLCCFYHQRYMIWRLA